MHGKSKWFDIFIGHAWSANWWPNLWLLLYTLNILTYILTYSSYLFAGAVYFFEHEMGNSNKRSIYSAISLTFFRCREPNYTLEAKSQQHSQNKWVYFKDLYKFKWKEMTCSKWFHVDEECEQILNHFGINHSDFTGSNRTDLENFSDLKNTTGLTILDLSYLQEWNCRKVERNIRKKMAIQSLQYDVNDLDNELVLIQQATKSSERWMIFIENSQWNKFIFRYFHCARFLEYIKRNTKVTAVVDRVFEEKRCEYNLLLDRKVKTTFYFCNSQATINNIN